MEMIPSAEQEKFFAIDSGYYLGVANAGTGKTTTCAEFIALKIHGEIQRLGGANFTNWTRAIKQVHAVTFTRKAAQELDDRIKSQLRERGLPIDQWLQIRPIRIGRTLDSLMQSWLRHPMMVDCWLQLHPNRLQKLAEIQQRTGSTLSIKELAQKWPWLLTEEVSQYLWKLVIGARYGFNIIKPGHLIVEWRQYLSQGLPDQASLAILARRRPLFRRF